MEKYFKDCNPKYIVVMGNSTARSFQNKKNVEIYLNSIPYIENIIDSVGVYKIEKELSFKKVVKMIVSKNDYWEINSE